MTSGRSVAGATGIDTEPDVDAVSAAVLACPDVAALSGGVMGEVATYLPGRRVRGVVLRQDSGRSRLDVHVVGRFGPTMAEISAQVHAAIAGAAPGIPAEVTIDDLDLPAGDQPDAG